MVLVAHQYMAKAWILDLMAVSFVVLRSVVVAVYMSVAVSVAVLVVVVATQLGMKIYVLKLVVSWSVVVAVSYVLELVMTVDVVMSVVTLDSSATFTEITYCSYGKGHDKIAIKMMRKSSPNLRPRIEILRVFHSNSLNCYHFRPIFILNSFRNTSQIRDKTRVVRNARRNRPYPFIQI